LFFESERRVVAWVSIGSMEVVEMKLVERLAGVRARVRFVWWGFEI